MGKKRRKQISSIAKRILSGELSLQEVTEAGPKISLRRFKIALSGTDIAVLVALLLAVIFVWNWLQDVRQQRGLAEEPEAKERFFGSLIDTFAEMQAKDDEELWPFLPKPAQAQAPIVLPASSPSSQRGSRARTRSETSGGPKSAPRKRTTRTKRDA